MSELDPAMFAEAARVPVWTRPPTRRFTAAASGDQVRFSAWADQAHDNDQEASPPPSIDNAEALIADGYAQGLAEGRRVAELELADERAALARLAETLRTLEPEPPAALAAQLALSVRRLVTQIVGEIEIDDTLLAERTRAAAAVIAEDAAPARLRLNPRDIERLADARIDLERVADPSLSEGAIVLETAAGWLEDGPAARLDKLRLALDRLGCPR